MKLLSVCVSTPRAVRSKSGGTGNHIIDTENHGGPDQAVCIYTQPDDDFWSAQPSRSLEPGGFGENLLFSELEATCAPIPCVTLAERMGDPGFVRRGRGCAHRPRRLRGLFRRPALSL